MPDDAAKMESELEAARATIISQARRIQQLEGRVEETGVAGALRGLVELSDVMTTIVGDAPYRALLDGIVAAACQLFDAAAASIALLDRAADELVFQASNGAGSEDVVGLRFPSHQGIAGWVLMTGEPIAVSDVRRDPRFAQSFAESTGYVPRSIMAVPLLVGDEVEGVLEVLDKKSATSFGLEDMDLLGLFARPAALAVEQARLLSSFGSLLLAEVGSSAGEQGRHEMAQAAQSVLEQGSVSSDQMLELARLVQALSKRGEDTRQLAIEILESVARHAG